LRQATLTGQPYPVKGWFVYSSNIINALPNQDETIKAINALDLLVVIDTMPSEIAGYADVVLPESTFLERHDELLTPASRRGWLALRQPVMPSPHEQKPGWWIAKQLAEKLGVGACIPFKDMEEYLRTRIEKGGYDWAKFKREGIILGAEEPIYAADGAKMEFDTPSGKVEFYSEQLKAKGFDPVPRLKKRDGPPAGFFRMVTGRAPMHTFSRTQTNPLLADVMPENEVWVHAETAKTLGLANNQYVRLKNQDGVVCNRVRVKATQRIRPDTVYMVYGFGHTSAQLKSAYLKGASAAQLLSRYEVDPLMGGTSMHSNFVTFVKEA
jgi:thiosulfate reductase/polysulfide reductase chain A